MSNEHPVTPPDELVQELWNNYHSLSTYDARTAWENSVVNAYRAGADAELEAILKMGGQQDLPEEDRYFDGFTVAGIRAARRPKPPSLAEQALDALERVDECAVTNMSQLAIHDYLVAGVDTIRRALERLQELEESNE